MQWTDSVITLRTINEQEVAKQIAPLCYKNFFVISFVYNSNLYSQAVRQ